MQSCRGVNYIACLARSVRRNVTAMRRTLEDRRRHAEFAEQALRCGVQRREVVRELRDKFGITLRQARYELQQVTAAIDREGDDARRGRRLAEDLSLTLRRLEAQFRLALAAKDHRRAFKAEKARCRLLGLYAPQRQTPPEIAQEDACQQRDAEHLVDLPCARRKLRQVAKSGPPPASLDEQQGLAPPRNLEHQPDCKCWMCNPLYHVELEEQRRREFPEWLAAKQKAEAELTQHAAQQCGDDTRASSATQREAAESDDEFRRRIAALPQADFLSMERECFLDPRPLAAKIEQRLAVLTSWLESGFSRSLCRRRYQERFRLSPRRAQQEWDLCLARFRDEGRYALRRASEALALGLALRRRELLAEHSRAAEDFSLGIDVEIDRARLLGLFPSRKRRRELLDEGDLDRVAAAAIDHLDPAGRGAGLPTPRERQLLRRTGFQLVGDVG